MRLLWWPGASLRLLNLPRADAQAIDRAVQRWASSGEGLVIYVEGEYRLFVGAYVIAFFVDADTMHIDNIRRA